MPLFNLYQLSFRGSLKRAALLFLSVLLTLHLFAQPSISTFAPSTASPGIVVTITGNNFTGATAVSFGGAPAASFTVSSATSIQALVGQGASGNVRVTTPNGTAVLAGFSFIAPPVINSFSPASGPIGTAVTITGANFSPVPGNNIVYMGAVRAVVNTATTTALQITIPAGTTNQPITVTTNSLTGYSKKPFNLTFPAGISDFNPQTFAPRTTMAAGNEPYAICASDFDGDGKVDLAIPLRYAGAACVYRNTTTTPGNITFTPTVNFPTGNNAYSASAGDIDGDGKPDLVVVNSLAYGFSVLRNTSTPGNVAFAPKVDISTGGGQSWTAAIGDIDGDGKPDVVISYYSPALMTVFRNTSTPGNISFAPEYDLTTPSYTLQAVIGDLDGDGKPDIAVCSNGISIFKNTSTPGVLSFAPRTDIQVRNLPGMVSICDLDGDGKNDLAAGIFANIAVFRNTSTGGALSFSSETDLPTDNSPGPISTADLNGDGKPDLSTINSSSYTVTVLKNTSSPGALSFGASVSYSAGIYCYSMVTADLDGDGKPDIASTTANSTLSTISVFNNRAGNPVITSFTPTSAKRGGTVRISGFNLTGVDSVSFGGTAAPAISALSDTAILAGLGSGMSGSIRLHTPLGVATATGFTFTGPAITACTPDSAGMGTVVTITGINLTGATAVSFGGTPAASYTVASATKITATMGAGSSGKVMVITPVDTAFFTGVTYFPAPVLTGMNPSATDSGHVVLLTGSYLATTKSVSFGGTPSPSFTVLSDNSISAVVGKGTSGSVQLTTIGGTVSLPGFVYSGTTLTSFVPGTAGPGALVTLYGTNFTGAMGIRFGAAAATAFTVVSDTVATAVVGAGGSGAVWITSPKGSASLPGFTYNTNQPVVTGMSPISGPVGTVVTITGANFDPLPANNIVYFGNVKAAVSSVTANALTVTLPVGASYQPVTVTRNNLISFTNAFTPTYPNGGNVDTSSYAPSINLFIGHYPYSLVATDLDGDGKADLAATVLNTGSVALLQNTTSSADTITFTTPVTINGGGAAFYITAADLNGDGKPDLVMPNQNGNTVTVLPNTSTAGSISFGAMSKFATGALPFFVATGDLDGDGRIDMVSANVNVSSVSVFQNNGTNGNISFAPKIDLATETRANNLAIGDLDGDGRPELVIPTSHVSVYPNTSRPGTISFGPLIDFPAGLNPQSVAIADLDGDGKPEMIIANTSSNNLYIYKNTSTVGRISFAPQVVIPTGSSPRNIAIADVNGDGKPDITLADTWSNAAGVLQNISGPGNIAFAPVVEYAVGVLAPIYGSQPMGITSGDFNGDGRPDMALANYGGSEEVSVSILRNKMNNPLQPVLLSFTPATAPHNAQVVLKGTHFTGATSVSFGGTPAQSFTIDSDTAITATTGSGASGVVAVTTPYGTASLGGFTYIYPIARISSFLPVQGRTGDTITLKGSDLTTVTGVRFGTIPARSFIILSDTVITAIVDTGASGSVSVLSTQGKDSLPGFSFLPPGPSILSFTPASGKAGSKITIKGAHFTGATIVRFGGTAASSFTVDSANTITAILGNGDSGPVSVETPNGTMSYGNFVFQYPPKLVSFTPASGRQGDLLTIKGHYLTGTSSVTLGGIPVASFVLSADSTIYAVIGTGATGTVVITSPTGTDSLNGFTFISAPPPVVTPILYSFSPDSAAEGDMVTIRGLHLDSVTAISFGGMPAQSFSIVSDSAITAIIGSGASGMVVATYAQGADTLGGFSFIKPPVTPPAPSFKLLSFTGTISGGKDLLQWKVLNEKGILHYLVDYSPDSSGYQTIGVISAMGLDSATYLASNANTPSGIRYYRLRIVDTSGNFTFSPVVIIQPGSVAPNITVYPNPANDLLQAIVPGITKPSKFQLVDMAGNIVQTVPVSPGVPVVKINVKALFRGTYYLVWSDGTNYSYQIVLIMR